MEKKKNKTSVSLKTSQRQKDENIPKYNELNQDINKLIRTINMQFDFKNFKKEKLISLKEYFSQLKDIVYNNEILIIKALERGLHNLGINNLLHFWSEKIRDNLTNFFVEQNLLILIDEIDQKITKIESKKQSIDNEKKKEREKIRQQKIESRYGRITVPLHYKPIIKDKEKGKNKNNIKESKNSNINKNNNNDYNIYNRRSVETTRYNRKNEEAVKKN